MTQQIPGNIHRELEKTRQEMESPTPEFIQAHMNQWLLTIETALPHETLWKEARIALMSVMEHLDAVGRYNDTINYLYTGIKWSTRYNDPRAKAGFEIQLGQSLLQRGNQADAYALLEAGSRYFTDKGINHLPAVNAKVQYLTHREEWETAKALATQALIQALTVKDRHECALAYRNLGIIALIHKQAETALHYFVQSSDFWNDKPRYRAFGLVNEGTAMRMLQRYDDAHRVYQTAIEIFDQVQDPINRAIAQSNLGNVFLKQARYQMAIEQYYLAEQILSASDHRSRLANIYNNWGMAYDGLKQYEYAIQTYEHSIGIWTELDKPYARANDLDNMGVSMMKMGEYQQAVNTFERALADLATATPDSSLRQEVLEHLAEVRAKLK